MRTVKLFGLLALLAVSLPASALASVPTAPSCTQTVDVAATADWAIQAAPAEAVIYGSAEFNTLVEAGAQLVQSSDDNSSTTSGCEFIGYLVLYDAQGNPVAVFEVYLCVAN